MNLDKLKEIFDIDSTQPTEQNDDKKRKKEKKKKPFDNKMKIIITIGFIGIFLIFISDMLSPNNTQEATTENKQEATNLAAQIEINTLNLLNSIEGVGECKILITYETDTQYIYEYNTSGSQTSESTTEGEQSSSSDSEYNMVIIDGSGGEIPVIKTTKWPEIQGIVVACEGGANIEVESRVVNALRAAFQISSNKIYVTVLKTEME